MIKAFKYAIATMMLAANAALWLLLDAGAGAREVPGGLQLWNAQWRLCGEWANFVSAVVIALIFARHLASDLKSLWDIFHRRA